MQGNFTTVQQVQNYAANCNVEIQKCHEEVQTLSEGTAGVAYLSHHQVLQRHNAGSVVKLSKIFFLEFFLLSFKT